ncbi:rhomboid family intramembrane serine protease [Halomonas daqiaonensis]|uniref:Membrane associated serine protease, rhomboid family n=1 Tax=Halomonas daqiaonensis TaxID=650850 RepID=A0A1H7JJY1_9GAMM|nr:rhomboid family intramembrane serine protease [Halomonas daqiaonensis]SEK73775.1 Membrane associated serine protease, rhomboid family [Halomonas daqiaonensis]
MEEDRKEATVRGPTPVVITLLLANGLIYLVLLSAPYLGMEFLALWPLIEPLDAGLPPGTETGEFHLWQLVTYAFLHGGLLHLFINMFVLWMFGGPIEREWGSARFAAFYGFCIVGAAVVQLMLSAIGMIPPVPAVGASGGVFAILLAFGMKFPNQIVVLLIPPIPMKAKYFVIFLGIFQLLAGVFGTQQGVANFAHLAGMLFGLIFILLFDPGKRR